MQKHGWKIGAIVRVHGLAGMYGQPAMTRRSHAADRRFVMTVSTCKTFSETRDGLCHDDAMQRHAGWWRRVNAVQVVKPNLVCHIVVLIVGS